MKSKRLILSLLLAVLSLTAFAQGTITVTGIVYDETDMPMIGVGVMQSGTTHGTVTDIDGKFQLNVPSNATLTFSYISYSNQDVAVNGKTELTVKMAPDNTVLEEVVVVGYGTMKKSDLTGSVASVSSKTLEDYKTSSIVEALSGQVAGVNITAADGTPGAGFDVKIRGVGTVNGESAPLYIVDGFEVDNIDFLANQDIQSIEVLKDASASAIYGARAANGVVLVTTKSGIEGKPQITYNGSATYRILSKRLEVLDPYEFVNLTMETNPSRYADTYFKEGNNSEGNPYKYQTMDDYKNVKGIDWQDEAFSPTWSQNHDLSVMGGNKDSRYTISFSHFDENGIFPNTGYVKTNARVKLHQRITKWLTLDGSVNYTNSKKTGIGTGGGTLATLLRYRPTGGLSVTDDELRHSVYDPLAEELGHANSTNSNPILQAESVDEKRNVDQWIANASLNFELCKGLTFKTAATYNASYQRNDTFFGEKSSQATRSEGVYGQSRFQKNLRWQNSNTLTYKRKFDKKHNTEFMLGHEVSARTTEWLEGQAKNFPSDLQGTDNLGLGATPSKVSTYKSKDMRLSFFARVFYGYDNRYMLTATVRADASTVFSPKHKWGAFPSFAAAWNISNEDFMKDAKNVSNLKLRLGWGTVGNDRIANFLSMDLYNQGKIGLGNNTSTVLIPKHLPNPDLKWEGSTTANIGLDMGFFGDRLKFTLDGFVKDTKDLLLEQNLAFVTGFRSQWQNIGKVRNAGFELTINSINFNRRNFGWKTDFNISYVKNTLVALQDGTDYMLSSTAFNHEFKNSDYIATVGSPLGDMYGYIYDGVYQYSDFEMTPDNRLVLKDGVVDMSKHAGIPVDQLPGMVKYKDMDNDGEITTADRRAIGNGQPDVYGGITNTFNFYGVDLSFMFQFSIGNDVYNATRMFCTQTRDERSNQLAEVKDRWTPTNASNVVPKWDGYVKGDVYSRFIEDGSFLRLKNLTLGYSIPEKALRKIHVRKLRIYTTMQNLFCVSKYSGYDPEVSMNNSPLMPGFDWGAYPKSKGFTFGLELQF